MAIEDMFGDLQKIDILAETKTGEVVMVLVCNGFIDGSPETQKALLGKMEGYLNYTQSLLTDDGAVPGMRPCSLWLPEL